MSRQPVRDMKRHLIAGRHPESGAGEKLLARDSALSLLERSINFGHGRLAVIRLSMAVCAGVDVPRQHWAYCEAAVEECKDPAIEDMWQAANAMAARRFPSGNNISISTHWR